MPTPQTITPMFASTRGLGQRTICIFITVRNVMDRVHNLDIWTVPCRFSRVGSVFNSTCKYQEATRYCKPTRSEFLPQFAGCFQAFRGDCRSLIEIKPESFDQFGQVDPRGHSRWLHYKGIGAQFIGP